MTENFLNLAGTFMTIFLNNMRVLLFCITFAFFYGVGAIFILTWNASIIGVVISNFAKNSIGNITAAISIALARYLIHGIPEIIAYFMAGLAGGIISIAVVRHHFKSEQFRHILTDSLDLVIGAIMMLVIAGLLEIFVSPLIA